MKNSEAHDIRGQTKNMLKLAFVIMAIHFEYNDEYSYSLEGNPGVPVAVYPTEEEANARCEELELEEWRKTCDPLCEYMWGSFSEITSEKECDEAQVKMAAAFPDLEDIDLDEFTIPRDATDEQLMVVRDVYHFIQFYTVERVEQTA